MENKYNIPSKLELANIAAANRNLPIFNSHCPEWQGQVDKAVESICNTIKEWSRFGWKTYSFYGSTHVSIDRSKYSNDIKDRELVYVEMTCALYNIFLLSSDLDVSLDAKRDQFRISW